mmetsp:Transcript_90016/g.178975  ORF Transcript_90016/g.178975 Transcript_90016/m.178975 type:complete len:276 (-) Transcript_90016:80-907(-)|eukprot:CAMPEP_0172721788 /NCGR_PEP_ID=MMETSP1074-20121228/79888_1 /TAXON_ID=2916 /ORGANISM="Ceratium fusus, Strain PA161109" /LENGTH=275 /DNA_ID=CAMNT_0013547619 /DNA_START=54 /DNA_END=881 /DNA_ORIENTATION=-
MSVRTPRVATPPHPSTSGSVCISEVNGRWSPRASAGGSSTPQVMSPRTPRGPSLKLQATGKRQTLGSLVSSARTPQAAALCKDLEEMLNCVPARAAENLQSGFLRLIGELHALEQRQISQTKAAEELKNALARLPELPVIQERLIESERAYQMHMEQLSKKDKIRVRRTCESQQRAQRFSARAIELVEETDRLRHERLARKDEARHLMEMAAQPEIFDWTVLAPPSLVMEIEAKRALLQQLEGELPQTCRINEEYLALSRRLAQLSGEPQSTCMV